MKKVNLGIALSLISGVAVANTNPINTSSNNEQHYSSSKVLVKPKTENGNLLLAQAGNGGIGGNGGMGGNAGSGNGGNGGMGGNAGSGNGGSGNAAITRPLKK